MDVIRNCLVTRTDAKVLKEYCIDRSNPLYRKYKGFNTSLNLEATSVYSLYSGIVSMITGDSKLGYEVVVLLNLNQAIRYSNLKSINVKINQQVDVSQLLGEAKKVLVLEYLSTYTYNQYSFRLGTIQMYKDDPMKLFSDSNVVTSSSHQFNDSGLQAVISEYDSGIDPSVRFMLSGNRG